MTDYGPGHGNAWQQPEPWHPDDPLFGDQGWENAQQQQQQQQQQYPQYDQQQQQQYDPQQQQAGWDPYAGNGQQQQQEWAGAQDPYAGHPQAHIPQQGHPDTSGQWDTTQGWQQQQQQQTHGWQVQQGYDTGQFATGYEQGYGNDAYAADGYGYGPDAYATDGHGTGGYATDAYGNTYATGQFTPYDTGYDATYAPGWEQTAAIPAQAPPAEPPPAPQPPPQAAAPAPPAPRRPADQPPDEDWNPFDDDVAEETHPFFTRGHGADIDADDADEEHERRRPRDDDDDDDDALPRPAKGRSKGKGKDSGKGRSTSRPKDGKDGKKGRSGVACLAVVVVLGGAVAGGGYAAYTYYENHIAPPPDWSGTGTGTVQITVPDSSTLGAIGNILKAQGVVESVDAFTRAAADNPKSAGIQGGAYTMHKHMSAAAAVAMMLDPASQSTIIISEGMRDAQIYVAVDKRLRLKPGTTRSVARDQAEHLGLPSWADSAPNIKDPLEGFLFPSRYSVAKGEKPATLLRQMVAEAKQQYTRYDVVGEARQRGLSSPLQLITVASLVQAEGKSEVDFRKMAKVVYNRINPTNPETYGALQFDSTYNYAKNTSQAYISKKDLDSLADPYNTYHVKGLPPGPIGNPGTEALQSVMKPDPGDWYYFISLDGRTTQFTKTYAEFQVLYAKYNAQHRDG